MANGYKTGGRKAGTPNKNTSLVRTMCNYLVDSGYEKFKTELNKLEGEKYVNCFLRLAEIATDSDLCKIEANKKLVDMLNEKIQNYETSKQ